MIVRVLLLLFVWLFFFFFCLMVYTCARHVTMHCTCWMSVKERLIAWIERESELPDLHSIKYIAGCSNVVVVVAVVFLFQNQFENFNITRTKDDSEQPLCTLYFVFICKSCSNSVPIIYSKLKCLHACVWMTQYQTARPCSCNNALCDF